MLFPQLLSGQQSEGLVGEIVLDLPPGPENSRNGEGDFITLNDGRILFIYTRFGGTEVSDHAPATLVSRISEDEGRTWSQEDKLEVDQEGEMNVMSVSLVRFPNDQIALFYMRKNALDDALLYVRTSSDEADTWTEPRLCINDLQGYFVTNNDRVVVLSSGRIVLPVSRHNEPGATYHNKGEMRCYYSDDQGQSWMTGNAVPTPDSVITQEPGVVELKDGTLLMVIRASGGFQFRSYSCDGGVNWSYAHVTSLMSPVSPTSLERLPSTGHLLMIWNNNGDSGPGYFKAKRTPLTMAISEDDGHSWKYIKNIEPDPDGFYCYTAIHDVGTHILLSYVSKKIEADGLGALIRRVRIEDIYR